MVVPPSTIPNTFLVDMSDQQVWLEAETQSVSSLEVDSDSDSEESETGSDSSSQTSSEEDEEEEIELLPPPEAPPIERRVSRKDRIIQQHQIEHEEQLAPVASSLRKTTKGSSAPNLRALGGFGFRKPTNLGGLCTQTPAQVNAPIAPTAARKNLPNPDQGLKPPKRKLTPGRKQTNANWNNASGATKAGLSLLNDVRIGMKGTGAGAGTGAGLNKIKKSMMSQLLDVSLKSQQSSTGETSDNNPQPPPTPQDQQQQQEEKQEITTVNVTTVSVSVSFTGSRTPSQGTVSSAATPKSPRGSAQDLARFRRAQNSGPVIISPKRTSRSPRRAARRRNNSAGDIVDATKHSIVSEEDKQTLMNSFRHIQSDPDLWIVEHVNSGNGTDIAASTKNRWNSNSLLASGSDHTRESRKKTKTLIPTSIKVISALPAEAPRSGVITHRKQQSSAPNLLGMTLSIPTAAADGRDASPAANNSRWSSSSRMKTSSSASAISDRDPAAGRWAPEPATGTTRNLSSHSAPDYSRWLAKQSKSDDGMRVDRWKSIVAPLSSTPKQELGAKAKSLSDIFNKRGAAAPQQDENLTTTTITSVGKRAQMMMGSHCGSAPNLFRRRGLSPMRGSGNNSPVLRGSRANSPVPLQRTNSRMVMSTSTNKLSAPNLEAMNTINRGGGGGGSAPMMPPPPPPADSKNARWSPTGIVGKAGSLSSSRPNSSDALNAGTTTTKATSHLQQNQRGVQRRSPTQTLRKQFGGIGLSTPNFAGQGRRLGSGLSDAEGCVEGGLQRGVQRTSSRMVMSTSSSGLRGIGISAPDLLRVSTVPQTGPSRNAGWSPKNTTRQGMRSSKALMDLGRTSSPIMNKLGRIGLSTPNLAGLRDRHSQPVAGVSIKVVEPETRLQRGVQRTSSKMVVSTSRSGLRGNGLSAPNLLGLTRSSPATSSGSSNAQWEGGSIRRTPGVCTMMKTSDLLHRGVQRASSRMVMSSSKLADVGLSAPHLQSIMQANTKQQSWAKNDQWNSKGNDTGGLQAASSLLEQAVERTTSRPVAASTANRLRGIGMSAPNLAGLQRSEPTHGPQNAQWVPKSSTRLGGPTLSMNPMVSVATPVPSSTLASSRWDSASNFDVLRSSGSGSNIVGTSTTASGMKLSSQKNRNESSRNPSSPFNLKASRVGASAPNLMAMKRVYAMPPLNGSSNAGWSARSRVKQPVRKGLEAMLDDNRLAQVLATPPCGRWEDNGSSGNLSGMDQLSTKKMLPTRRNSKSGGRRKKKKHKEDSKQRKADTAPPKVTRSRTFKLNDTSKAEPEGDSKPSTDGPSIDIGYTDESIESRELAEEIDAIVKDVTDCVTLELHAHTESEHHSVAHATASIAALEITRSARMALRKQRSDNSLGGGKLLAEGTRRLGCTETIPERGDESVDFTVSEAYNDFDDEDEDYSHAYNPEDGHCHGHFPDEFAGRLDSQADEDINHSQHRVPFVHEDSDRQLKAPVRHSSGQSQNRGSITGDNAHREPPVPAPKPASNGPSKPVRRSSVITGDTLSAMMPGFHQDFGIDDNAVDIGFKKHPSRPIKPVRRSSVITGDTMVPGLLQSFDIDDNAEPKRVGAPAGSKAPRLPPRKTTIDSSEKEHVLLAEQEWRQQISAHSLEMSKTARDIQEETGLKNNPSRPFAAIHVPSRRASIEPTGDGSLGLPFSHIRKDSAISDDDCSEVTMPSICSSSARHYSASMISHKGSSKPGSMKPPNMFGGITGDIFSMLAAGELHYRDPVEVQGPFDAGVEAKAEGESLNLEGPTEVMKDETQPAEIGKDEAKEALDADAEAKAEEEPPVPEGPTQGSGEEMTKDETQPAESGDESPAVEETDGIKIASEPLIAANDQFCGTSLVGEEAKSAGKDISRALTSRLPNGSTSHAGGNVVLRDGAIA